MKFRESALAHYFLDRCKRGIEIGAAAHNPFGLRTWNVDRWAEQTVYKLAELELCGEAAAVDVMADGAALPFLDESLDFVISSHVLEHLPDTIGALKEWYRVVKPGGYLFMILPHKMRTFDRHRERTPLATLVMRHHGAAELPGVDEHCVVWVGEDLVDLVQYLGWRVVYFQDVDDKVGNGFTVVVRK